ncbi:MAG: SRPBCC domain-containing protein [Sphingobacteriales bacterium]|nr:MAG: SRPBCC domain-containing protein [Sphingobacteriales bacterium]
MKSNTVSLHRVLTASPEKVFKAFSDPLAHSTWLPPYGFVCEVHEMDFKVGGQRFYAMISPDGQERWAIQTFKSITPKTNFQMHNAFADKDENPELPGSDWDYNFSERNGLTKVSITIYNESFERLEKLLEGFKIGFNMTLKNLENLLAELSQK